MTEEITFKATPFLAIIDYMYQRLPGAACETILEGMAAKYPDEVRRVRQKSILASDRLSLRFATELIERIAEALRASPASVAHDIGRLGAEESTGTVLRFVFALVSMSSFLGKIQPVWSQLYSHGNITYETRGKTATVELHDFPFVSATNCARVTGSFEWYGQRAEKTAVVRHTSCRSRGDAACRWDVNW